MRLVGLVGRRLGKEEGGESLTESQGEAEEMGCDCRSLSMAAEGDSLGYSRAMRAVMAGHQECLKEILASEEGAGIDGGMALLLEKKAARSGLRWAFEELLGGLKAEAREDFAAVHLAMAAAANSADRVREMLSVGNPNRAALGFKSALMAAVERGARVALEELLTERAPLSDEAVERALEIAEGREAWEREDWEQQCVMRREMEEQGWSEEAQSLAGKTTAERLRRHKAEREAKRIGEAMEEAKAGSKANKGRL